MLTFLLSFLLMQTQLVTHFNPDGVDEALKNHVKFITADSLRGRAAGSNGELAVAKYICKELNRAGVTMLSPLEGDDFFINDTINGKYTSVHSRNVLAIVEGYDPVLRDEFIVIGAHMDNSGVNRLTVDGKEVEQIFPGADANASGVAMLIELAKQIEQQKFLFRRSIVFAFFGAGEESCAGSWYFLNRSFKGVKNIVLMENLNCVGRSGGDNKFQAFTGVNNLIINAIIKEISNRPASISPIFSPHDYFASDHRMFYQKQIPITLFTTGGHRDVNTVKDTWDKLDYAGMVDIAEFVMAFTQNVANMEKRLDTVSSLKTSSDSKGKIYTQMDVDKMAQFIHSDERQFLEKWVYKYIKYPETSLKEGVQGRVIVDFVIETDGSVSNVQIIKSVSEDIDNEVIKVVSSSPKWKAALLGEEKVRVRISVPVDFKLSNSSDRAKFSIKR